METGRLPAGPRAAGAVRRPAREELRAIAASAARRPRSARASGSSARATEQSAVYVIVDGEVAVMIDDEDRRVLSRGAFFGEMSVLLREPASASVITRTPLDCLVVPGAEFEEFLLAHPQVTYRDAQGRGPPARDGLRVADVSELEANPTPAPRGAPRLPPDRRARGHRRPAHRGAGRHGRHDRLVLLPALRLAERLRGDPRPPAAAASTGSRRPPRTGRRSSSTSPTRTSSSRAS